MDWLRIIGDVHGHITKKQACTKPRNNGKYYLDAVRGCEFSLQVGDMGFDYSPIKNARLDYCKHQFIGGNHDNYDVIEKCQNYLGDFGMTDLGAIEIFYCRGAYSIDKEYRLQNYAVSRQKSWWSQEELSYARSLEAIQAYKDARNFEGTKPNIVVTHDAPDEITKLIGNPEVLRLFGHEPDGFTTSSQMLLQAMFDEHKPDLWVFGHYHKNWNRKVKGTQFVCVDELDWLTLDEKGEIYDVPQPGVARIPGNRNTKLSGT